MLKEIDISVLDKLRCPDCRKSGYLLKSSSLTCNFCGNSYKIIKNVILFAKNFNSDEYEKEKQFWQKNIKNFYDDESEGSYRKYLVHFPLSPEDEVIEIGCGSGAMLNHIQTKLKVGVDLSLHMLSYGNNFYAVQALAENLPIKDETFNLVYFKHSLHHVLDKEKALKEAVRITKKNGSVIICEPNLSHPQRKLLNNPDNILRKAKILTRFMGPIETFMTEKQAIELCTSLNLSHVKTIYLESSYDKISLHQRLQKIYRAVFNYILPDKYLYPNYIILFRKG